ncbi:MAG: SDR family NAD(P)-dependent oxidoreductase [bacterium]
MDSSKSKALVVGVGAELGLGAALCLRFAREGYHVDICGRTPKKIETISERIKQSGGSASTHTCDATNEQSVSDLFGQIEKSGQGDLKLIVFNVGNNMPGNIRDMESEYFSDAWRAICFGGFLVAREVTKRLLPGTVTLIFTGASASLRGRPGFAAFNSAKAALRTFAQALAKEYGKEGLHVCHVVIDGGIAGQKWLDRNDGEMSQEQTKKLISLEGLTDAYWNLHQQKPEAWSFEIDVRTSLESW